LPEALTGNSVSEPLSKSNSVPTTEPERPDRMKSKTMDRKAKADAKAAAKPAPKKAAVKSSVKKGSK